MKRINIAGLVMIMILCLSVFTYAAEISGELSTELRIPTKGDDNFDNTVGSIIMNLDIQDELGDIGTWKVGINGRFYDQKLDDKFKNNTTDEIEDYLDFTLDEAYATFYDPFEWDMDFNVGKQYITYGVGDKISTLNLCSPSSAFYIDDVAKNETKAIDGIRANWYPGDYQVDFFVQPRMTPAFFGDELQNVYTETENQMITGYVKQQLKLQLLQSGISAEQVNGMVKTLPVSIDSTIDSIDYDDNGPGIMCKVTKNVSGYDLGLNYQRGYVPVPLISDVTTNNPANFATEGVKVNLNKEYMFMQKVGLTATGTIDDASVWGELTYNKPEEDFFAAEVADNKNFPEEYRFSDEEYFTGLIGADYFFEDGTYVNAQFISGFPQEFTKSMVNNYITLDTYNYFMNDRLKAEAVICYCTSDQGWVFTPELSYQFKQNVNLWIKANCLGGKDDSVFNKFKDQSQVVLGVTTSF